jgi:hypothetical protein
MAGDLDGSSASGSAGDPDGSSGSGAAGDRIGLCADCRFAVRQGTRRGAIFFRCARAERDAAFARYPPLPVRRCPGYDAAPRGLDDAPGSE